MAKSKQSAFETFSKDFVKDNPHTKGVLDTWSVRPHKISILNQIFKSKSKKWTDKKEK